MRHRYSASQPRAIPNLKPPIPRLASTVLHSTQISRDLETFSFPSRQWRLLLVSIQSGMMVPVSASTLKRTGVEFNLWRLIYGTPPPGCSGSRWPSYGTAASRDPFAAAQILGEGRGRSGINLDLRAGVELASRCRRKRVSTSALGTVRYFASKSLPQCIATALIVSELRGLWPLSPERHSHRPRTAILTNLKQGLRQSVSKTWPKSGLPAALTPSSPSRSRSQGVLIVCRPLTRQGKQRPRPSFEREYL